MFYSHQLFNKKSFLLTTLLVLVLAFPAAAQIDSLKKVLPAMRGKQRVLVLNMLTVQDSADFEMYHDEAVKIAGIMHDSLGEVRALIAMGDHYFNYLEPEKANTFYQNGIQLASEYGLHREEIVALGKFGIALEEIGEEEKALQSYEEALEKSRKWGPEKELAIALEQLGIYYLNRRKYKNAIDYFQQQQIVNQRLQDSASMANCFNNIGMVYYSQSDFTNSIIYYRKAMAIKERTHDSLAVARAQINIGITYKDEGAYDLALESILQAVRYFEMNPGELELASCLNTIGNLQMELGNNDSALAYFTRSLKIREKIQNKRGIAGSLTNIGNVYKKMNQFGLAHEYLGRSLVIKREIGDELLLASSLDLIGEVYALEGNYKLAEQYYSDALKLRTGVRDQKGVAMTLNNFGDLYTNWNKTDSALSCLTRAGTISHAIGSQQVLLRNYELMVKAYRRSGQPEKALVFYDRFAHLKDSLFSAQKSTILTELQLKYETEKSEQKIAMLNQKEKLQEVELKRRKSQNYSLIAGILFLIVIVALSFIAIRTRSKALKQSQIIAEQKQVMMQELHHRVKNNLQAIVSMLELQEDNAGPETQAAIKSISSRLNAMLLIHSDLYSKDAEGLVSVKDYLLALTAGLTQSFGQKENFNLVFEIDELFLEADMTLNIGFIYNEVITNAFKHAFGQVHAPSLTVSLKLIGDEYHLRISDNGIGLPENGFSEKESFGLRLVRFFAGELDGKVKFYSGKPGTVFDLIIPQK